jgi:hypothetical protein
MACRRTDLSLRRGGLVLDSDAFPWSWPTKGTPTDGDGMTYEVLRGRPGEQRWPKIKPGQPSISDDPEDSE